MFAFMLVSSLVVICGGPLVILVFAVWDGWTEDVAAATPSVSVCIFPRMSGK